MNSKFLNKKSNKECGASLLEYALLVALISIISIAGVQTIGSTVSNKFTETAYKVESPGSDLAGADDNP